MDGTDSPSSDHVAPAPFTGKLTETIKDGVVSLDTANSDLLAYFPGFNLQRREALLGVRFVRSSSSINLWLKFSLFIGTSSRSETLA